MSMLFLILNSLAPVLEASHNSSMTLWDDFLSVAFDPAHILAELFFSIMFDGIILALGWNILFKKIILPRLKKQIHAEIDEQHGIGPHTD